MEKKPFLGIQLFKQRKGKEVEKKSRYGILVWNLCVWICWLENPPKSLFSYVWVRRTLSLYKMILVGVNSVLWLVLGFSWKFRVKIGKPEITGEY